MDAGEPLEYAGFWLRFVAFLVDSALIVCVIYPVAYAVYGAEYFTEAMAPRGVLDFLLSWVLPAVAVIAFWIARQATPGKMVVGARVVDAKTGGTLSIGQSLARYVGYYVATIPLGLGLLWVAFDQRKQGWHDKMAGTVVVRTRRRAAAPVTFDKR